MAPMSDGVRFFDAQAELIVKQAVEDSKLTKKQLAKLMKSETGVIVNDLQLANRINRGRFSLSFALQVMRALGKDSIPVPRVPSRPKKTVGR